MIVTNRLLEVKEICFICRCSPIVSEVGMGAGPIGGSAGSTTVRTQTG